MKKLILGIVALSAAWLTGCASIVDGNNQTVSFASNPDGATVYLNGAAIGKTPMNINTKRQGGAQPVRFSKEGFKDVDVQMTSTLNPWFLGNVLSGGLLGSTTDGLSGAAFKYAPGAYMVTLPPAEAAVSDSTALNDKQQVVNFIVAGYQGLQKDMAVQGGQYLTSLMTLAKVADDRKADMTMRLKGLSDAYTSIPEFADKAADALLAQP